MSFKLVGRFLFSLVLVCLLAAGSQWTVGREPDHSVLRLSWVHVGEKVTKVLSQDELDALPIHMRPQDGVVESKAIPYILKVSIDGTERAKQVVMAAGLQQDRPMHVFLDYPVSPGEHTVEISFQPDHEIEDAVVYRFEESVFFELGQIRSVGLVRGQQNLSVR